MDEWSGVEMVEMRGAADVYDSSGTWTTGCMMYPKAACCPKMAEVNLQSVIMGCLENFAY